MKNELRYFLEYMRQQGTTESLVALMVMTKGYLVVGNQDIKNGILKKYPNIKELNLENNIITYWQINSGAIRGRPANKIFFDSEVISILLSNKNHIDGYQSGGYQLDGYQLDGYQLDGYQENEDFTKQLNIKLTDKDMNRISEINKEYFENEASNSMIGRILIKKGINYYENK